MALRRACVCRSAGLEHKLRARMASHISGELEGRRIAILIIEDRKRPYTRFHVPVDKYYISRGDVMPANVIGEGAP